MPRKPKPGAEQAAFQRKARKHADAALQALVDTMKGPDNRAKQAAALKILEFAFGRPASQPADTPDAATIRLLPGDENL